MILIRENVEKNESNEVRIQELINEGFVPAEETKPAKEKTVSELRKEAQEKGIDTKGMKKAELVEALEG